MVAILDTDFPAWLAETLRSFDKGDVVAVGVFQGGAYPAGGKPLTRADFRPPQNPHAEILKLFAKHKDDLDVVWVSRKYYNHHHVLVVKR